MTDLRTQVAQYGAQLLEDQAPLTADELLSGEHFSVATPPFESPARRERRRRILIAVAAALVLLLAFVPLLFLDGGEAPDIATTTPATTLLPAPSSTAIEPSTSPEVIAELVTPTSIGEARWTVYQGSSVDALEAFADAQFPPERSRSSTPPESLIAGEGVAEVFSRVVSTVDDTALITLGGHVDWRAAALLLGGPDLATRSDNGRLLIPIESADSDESGLVEVYMFASDDEFEAYAEATCCGSGSGNDPELPETLAARFTWTNSFDGTRWDLRVADADTGETIGAISSVFDTMASGPVFARVQGETSELVLPVWFNPGFEWFSLDAPDAMLIYVKPGDGNSPDPYEIWRSIDGRTWENLGPPPGFPTGYLPLEIIGAEGLYAAYLDDITEENEPGPDFLVIMSSNGIDWVQSSVLPTTDGSVLRVPAGWVLASIPGDAPDLVLWTSPDGNEWDRVVTTGVPGPFFGVNGGGSGWWTAGNRILVSNYQDDPAAARLWVVEFEPVGS